MRCLSVSDIKIRSRGGKVFKRPDKPMEGTRARQLYDLFFKYRGKVVPDPELRAIYGDTQRGCGCLRASMDLLMNTYGLDIRGWADPSLPRAGYKRKYKHAYSLVGEWFGKVYQDYTKEAQHDPKP